jgi:nitroreductase
MSDISQINRRFFLGSAAAALTVLCLPGCDAPEAGEGPAYAPWDFPDQADTPEITAVRAALLAASPHNTQPWRFEIAPDRIALFADTARHLGPMDSLRREMHIGLGCALENLALAARANGLAPTVRTMPDAARPDLVADIALALALGRERPSPLYDAIPHRHTNRGRYAQAPAPKALPAALSALVESPHVRLHLFASGADRRAFADGVVAATKAIIEDTEMSTESARWYRHSRTELENHRDGLTLDATGSGAALRRLGKYAGKPTRAAMDEYWLDGTRDRETTGSAYAILSTSDDSTRAQQLEVGRAFQRIALWAASEGLAVQPLNQMAERQDREDTQGLPRRFGERLDALTGNDQRRAQMLFRIGYPWDEARPSPRRPLAWVRL